MQIAKLSVAALALMSSVSVVAAKESYATPAISAALNVPTNGDKPDWATTIVQENEGTPNPGNDGLCKLIGRPVADVHRNVIGYYIVNVCS